jgi:tetratricopeptide (TPR) repeat protein
VQAVRRKRLFGLIAARENQPFTLSAHQRCLQNSILLCRYEHLRSRRSCRRVCGNRTGRRVWNPLSRLGAAAIRFLLAAIVEIVEGDVRPVGPQGDFELAVSFVLIFINAKLDDRILDDMLPIEPGATFHQVIEGTLAAFTRLAQFQHRDGKPEEAIKTYEKLLAADSQYAPATRQLALLYVDRSTDATKAYDLALKARQAYPDDAEVAKALGILSYRRDLYPRAVDLLTEVSGKRKDDADALYYLGEARHQLKQWNECKAALDRAVALKLPAKLADEAKRTLGDCTDNIPQPDNP